jgi:hypothetical protein
MLGTRGGECAAKTPVPPEKRRLFYGISGFRTNRAKPVIAMLIDR